MVGQQNLEGMGGSKTWSEVGHVSLVGAGEIDDKGTEAKGE